MQNDYISQKTYRNNDKRKLFKKKVFEYVDTRILWFDTPIISNIYFFGSHATGMLWSW